MAAAAAAAAAAAMVMEDEARFALLSHAAVCALPNCTITETRVLFTKVPHKHQQ
jgi:hypothetical protein